MLWFSWHFKYLDLGQIFWQDSEKENGKQQTNKKLPLGGWLKEMILVNWWTVAHFIEATYGNDGYPLLESIFVGSGWIPFHLVNIYWASTMCQTVDLVLSTQGTAIRITSTRAFRQWNQHAISWNGKILSSVGFQELLPLHIALILELLWDNLHRTLSSQNLLSWQTLILELSV